MSRRISVMTGLVALLASTSDLALAEDTADAVACWSNYSSCATVSFDDQSWRSICYADFSECLKAVQLPKCPAAGQVQACSEFLADCQVLAGADAVLIEQCQQDVDVCLFAHGC